MGKSGNLYIFLETHCDAKLQTNGFSVYFLPCAIHTDPAVWTNGKETKLVGRVDYRIIDLELEGTKEAIWSNTDIL